MGRPPPRDTSNHDKHSNNHGNAAVQSIAQRFGHLTFFWGCGANRRCNTNAEKPDECRAEVVVSISFICVGYTCLVWWEAGPVSALNFFAFGVLGCIGL